MKFFFLSIGFLFLSLTASIGHVNHYSDFNRLEYELFRNNKLIGFHNYDFLRSGDLLTVNSSVEFKITKLGVDLYKYKANSKEEYVNNKFTNFSSKTNQNNKEKYVNIAINQSKNTLNIDGSSYKGETKIDHIVGTWWNHEMVKANAQISAISGRVIQQNVTFIGKEKIEIGNKTFNALRFNFKSSDENLPEKKKLNTDVWYEEDTLLWLKVSFDKQGYWEYRLKNYK